MAFTLVSDFSLSLNVFESTHVACISSLVSLYLSVHLLLDCFQFGVVINKAAMIILCESSPFCRHMFYVFGVNL